LVNVTILVANRPRLTKQTLESLGDLSDITVTIRDAAMNADVFDAVNDWAIDRSVTDLDYYISSEPMGTGPARNQVVKVSENRFGRGDYLYISDDDVFFKRPDWLSILIEAYDRAWLYGYRVIGAYNHPYHHPIENVPVSDNWSVNGVYAVATQSMLMRWSVFDEFGLFCETPVGKVCQSEDADFCNRIRAAGYKVGVISPSLLVNTGITNSFGEKIVGWELVKKECPEGVICE
jgi:hypothetical protein